MLRKLGGVDRPTHVFDCCLGRTPTTSFTGHVILMAQVVLLKSGLTKLLMSQGTTIELYFLRLLLATQYGHHNSIYGHVLSLYGYQFYLSSLYSPVVTGMAILIRMLLGLKVFMWGFCYGKRNTEGLKLLVFATANDFVIGNSFFTKRESQLVTYESGGNESVADYILLRKQHLKLVKDI